MHIETIKKAKTNILFLLILLLITMLFIGCDKDDGYPDLSEEIENMKDENAKNEKEENEKNEKEENNIDNNINESTNNENVNIDDVDNEINENNESKNNEHIVDKVNKELKFDSFMFAQQINDARNRRLIEVIKPDLIQRGIYEWVGTDFVQNGWKGADKVIEQMHEQGLLVTGGVSGKWWAPSVEEGPATVSEEVIEKCTIKDTGWGNVVGLDITNKEALDHIIYKIKAQIDAGVDGVDIDEFGANVSNYEYVKEALEYISLSLKRYAREEYGKNFYISTNSRVGGQDFPSMTSAHNDGSEAIDFYIRNMPYRLIGEASVRYGSDARYDGKYNYIPELREAHKKVWPKRFAYFKDFGAPDQYWGPKNPLDWENWYRISSAHVIAAGGFPGTVKAFYNGEQDALSMGIFNTVANIAKFMNENSKLWHDYEFIEPKIEINKDDVYTSAFEKEDMIILHLVNGDYSNAIFRMKSQSDIEVKMPIEEKPTRIWMTTSDLISSERKSEPNWEYENGNLTIDVDQLEIHNILIIECGTEYEPEYMPTKVIFPFPLRKNIPINNKVKITAVQNEGNSNSYEWYVNDVLGGNNEVGLISDEGMYEACKFAADNTEVTIKAVSISGKNIYAKTTLEIIDKIKLPYEFKFEDKQKDVSMYGLQIVDGRGDFEIAKDSDDYVLENTNVSEGFGNADIFESALDAPFIIGGDQNWDNYTYSMDVKLNSDYIKYYGYAHGTIFGMVFRYVDHKNYYQYLINAENQSRLIKVKDGNMIEIGTTKAAMFPTKDKYNEYVVKVKDDTFTLEINSHKVREDKDSSIKKGAIGIKTSFINGLYKNITVK